MDQVVAQALTMFKKIVARPSENYVNGSSTQKITLPATNGISKTTNGMAS
jgi:hypothetical protein